MKKISLLTLMILALFSVKEAIAQNVGVNSTGAAPNTSAMLDVAATDKGLLVPRVTLSSINDVATITTPATSLLVYNTATAGVSPNNVTPGFYYYDGAKWVRLQVNA